MTGIVKARKDAHNQPLSKTIVKYRLKFLAAQPSVSPANVFHRESFIPCRGTYLPTSIYRPQNTNKPLPTLFYVPGTAFIGHEKAMTHMIASHAAQQSHCQVIVLQHRLAPEHPFPIGLFDAFAAFQFFLNSPPAWTNIDMTRIGILGYSSGGNFAVSMALLARQENLPVARLVLVSPLLDLSCSRKGYEASYENQDTTLPNTFTQCFLDSYVPRDIDRRNPWLSPFWQPMAMLRYLPAIDIFVGEYDRFRGDSEGYYSKLKHAGVDVRRFIVKDANHSFWWRRPELIQMITRRTGIALRSPLTENTPPHSHCLARTP